MIETKDKNALLRQDVNMLGSILGEILVLYGGQELYDQVESIRVMSKKIRSEYDADTFQTLKDKINHLKPPMRQKVIRAFSIYFHLINMAEQNHRVRRRRQYLLEEDTSQSLSLEHAVKNVKSFGLPDKEIQDVLQDLSIELVMTAHPTEATKRTVLEIQKRISEKLRSLDNPLTTPKEQASVKESLFNEITALWHTDELRHRKPEVLDEVRNGLYYFEHTIYDTLPDIFHDLQVELQEYVSEDEWTVPNFIHFGSWIGGDRDGNPNVTPDITWKTLEMQRDLVLRKYKASIVELSRRFSQSYERIPIDQSFIDQMRQDEDTYLTEDEKWRIPSEVYRRKFAVIQKRLSGTGKAWYGYNDAYELLNDLVEIKEHAEAHLPKKKKMKAIRKVIRQVELFGFHLATLDVRNHSGEHESAIHEILHAVGITDRYADLTEEEKQQILCRVLSEQRPLLLFDGGYSEATQKMLNVFRTIKQAHEEFGKRSIQVYLISMAEAPSDILEVLLLAKEMGIYRLYQDGHVESDIDVAPLLETIDDLIAGEHIMKTMFTTDVYRKQLKARHDHQEIMLGYSDGSKDGGALSANWNLFKAQMEIHNIAKEYNIGLKFFHGRGGSLGRGGGSLSTSILSQPVETLEDGVKITEQGEVLSSRYLIKDIAYRNLEQAAATLFEAHAKATSAPDHLELRKQEWEQAMDSISQVSLKKYQSLVFGDPEFLTYFNQATPLNEIGELNIGSRPMSRKNSQSFENLRAIPWVFSWTQSRHMLPAWYAAGSGLQAFIDGGQANLAMLQTMYQEWSFFHSTINNLQMALLKADMPTAKQYLELVEDPTLAKRIYDDIAEEYERTKQALLRITGEDELLNYKPNIQESVHLRNPYVDPLNFLQVNLLKELRESDNPSDALVTEVLLTINGVAAGLVNTG